MVGVDYKNRDRGSQCLAFLHPHESEAFSIIGRRHW